METEDDFLSGYLGSTDAQVSSSDLSLNLTTGSGSSSALDPVQQTHRPGVAWDYHQVARWLWVVGGPVIFAVGLVGNSLVVAVMAQRRMRGSSTSVYLTLMALADTLVLVTGIVPEWLEAARIVVLKQLHQALCKLEKFLFYTSADSAIWFLVVFTFDRFVAVCYPLQKNNFCRSSRAKLSCAVVVVVAVLKNVHVLVTRGSQYRTRGNETTLVSHCGKPNAACEYFEDFVRPWIAFVLVSVLPFCLILTCNVFIISALLRVRALRAQHSIASMSDKSLVQMTAMCLSASFCFLVCITPSIILLIGKPHWKRSNEAAYEIAKVVNNELVYVNHSVNFFLYCVTGKRFRSAIGALFRCRRRHVSIDSAITELSFESRTTAMPTGAGAGAGAGGGLTPSPPPSDAPGRRRGRSSVGLGTERAALVLVNGGGGGRRSIDRSGASLGLTNAVFRKTLSDLNADSAKAEVDRPEVARSRRCRKSYESVL